MTWHPDMPMEYRNQIVTGDARELAKRIPDESVDIVFTDPPYLKAYLSLYGWLAETAARVLCPGGWLFAYGAGEHLPDHLWRMDQYLDYYWVFVLKHQNGWPRMWQKRLMSSYKPVLVFTKGQPTRNPWKATLHGDSKDKKWHRWGQGNGLPIKMIEMLTGLDGIVLEPMAGGGTVPAVCKMLGRNYVAFEINPATAELARERVANTQPPLFVPEPEQMELQI